MSLPNERAVKKERVREYVGRKGLDGIFLSTCANFAWYTAGGSNHVNIASDRGVATVFATREEDFLITNNIEMHRILGEEVKPGEFQALEYPWHDDSAASKIVSDLIAGKKVRSDDGMGGTRLLEADFAELRYSLAPEEIERYRWLGRHSALAVEKVCLGIKQGASELEIAGNLASQCLAFGIVPVVLLVAADDRAERFRHPLPTTKKVQEHAMVVLCGRKWGLIASLTRILHLGEPSRELERRHEAVKSVDAALILETAPGKPVGEILKAGIETYGRLGFPEQWKLHHQGGPTGYATREYKATPGEGRRVQAYQAFAWNPSITGTKSEDTILAKPEGIEILTPCQSWPTSLSYYGERCVLRPEIATR